eukprot:6597895-Pyramimonas_sp.AAC.1
MCCWTDRPGFDTLLGDFMRRILEVRERAEQAAQECSGSADARSAANIARVRRLSQAWRASSRQVYLRAITDADGHSHEDAD